MLRLSLIVSILSLSASLVSFANQILLARFFGAGARLDEYLIAISVPTMVTGIAAGVFSYSIVPVLVRRRTSDPQGYKRFCGMLLLAFATLGVLIPLGVYGLAPAIIRGVAPNLKQESLHATIRIARVSWAAMGVSLPMSYLAALQNASRRFVAPVAASALPYLGMIVTMSLFARSCGTESLPWGLLAGYAVTLPVLYWGVSEEMQFDAAGIALWRQSIPVFASLPWVLVSLLCFTVYGTIDAFWASRLGAGNVSFLGYGQRLLVALGSVVVVGPSTVLTPHLAEASALGELDRFREILRRSMRMVLAVGAPAALVLSLLRIPVVELLFQRGAFDAEATGGVGSVLPGLLCGMVAMVGVVLLLKALHAHGDFRAAAAAGGGGTVLYFLLAGFLSRYWGVRGISSAYAATWWILFAACAWRIFGGSAARIFQLENLRFARALLVSLAAAWALIACGRQQLIHPAAKLDALSLSLRLAICAGLGTLGFLSVSVGLFRMSEIRALIQILPLWNFTFVRASR